MTALEGVTIRWGWPLRTMCQIHCMSFFPLTHSDVLLHKSPTAAPCMREYVMCLNWNQYIPTKYPPSSWLCSENLHPGRTGLCPLKAAESSWRGHSSSPAGASGSAVLRSYPMGGSRNAKCIPSRSALKHSPHPVFCFNWSKEDPTLQEQKFLITACHHILKNKSERRESPRIKHTFKSPTVINHSIIKWFKTVKISIPILTVCWWGKGDWSSRSQSILVIFYLVYACMRQKLNKVSNKI